MEKRLELRPFWKEVWTQISAPKFVADAIKAAVITGVATTIKVALPKTPVKPDATTSAKVLH